MNYDDNMACYIKSGMLPHHRNSVFCKAYPIVADTISALLKSGLTYYDIVAKYETEPENYFLFYKEEIITTCKAIIKEHKKAVRK